MAPAPFIPPVDSIPKSNEANHRRIANLVILIHKSVPSPTLNPIHHSPDEIPPHFSKISEYKYGAARPVVWDKGVLVPGGGIEDAGGEFPAGAGAVDPGGVLRRGEGWDWLLIWLVLVMVAVWGFVFWIWRNGWQVRGQGRVSEGRKARKRVVKGRRSWMDKRRRERGLALEELDLEGGRMVGKGWRGLVKSETGPRRWDGNVGEQGVEWRVVEAC